MRLRESKKTDDGQDHDWPKIGEVCERQRGNPFPSVTDVFQQVLGYGRAWTGLGNLQREPAGGMGHDQTTFKLSFPVLAGTGNQIA